MPSLDVAHGPQADGMDASVGQHVEGVGDQAGGHVRACTQAKSELHHKHAGVDHQHHPKRAAFQLSGLLGVAESTLDRRLGAW